MLVLYRQAVKHKYPSVSILVEEFLNGGKLQIKQQLFDMKYAQIIKKRKATWEITCIYSSQMQKKLCSYSMDGVEKYNECSTKHLTVLKI